MFIVELHQGTWLAPWQGDPGRTLVLDSAKQFNTEASAKRALAKAREYRKFPNTKILPVTLHVTT